MSPLVKNLRPASFRGVPFEVQEVNGTAGRRTELHEYPKRDKPFAEDNGRAARTLRFDAFVVGADYVAKANALLAALEQPGPGTLVHPWLGTLTVSQDQQANVTFGGALGFAKFSLNFVESGELTFPTALSSTASQSRLAATNLETVTASDFAKVFTVDSFPDFVEQEATAALTRAMALVAGGTVPGLGDLGYPSAVASVLPTALALLRNPASLAQVVISALGVAGQAGNGLRWLSLAQSLLRLAQNSVWAVPRAPVVYTPARYQSYLNTMATNTLMRQAALAQAVGVSSLVETTVYDDTLALRNGLTAALDAEALQASDTTFEALQTARTAVWRDLTDRSRDGARLTTSTPLETTPSLVLAYDLYEDASREGEIVTRNAIRNPGFVPPVALKVLTR